MQVSNGGATVDGSEIRRAPLEVGSLYRELQGFIHPWWCRISSINSMEWVIIHILDVRVVSYEPFWRVHMLAWGGDQQTLRERRESGERQLILVNTLHRLQRCNMPLKHPWGFNM